MREDSTMRETFNSAKSALITNSMETYKSVEDIQSIYWNEITLQANHLAYFRGYVPILESLEFEHFVEFIKKYLLRDGEERRTVLSVVCFR